MALLEKEAIRLADAVDDYDHLSVTDIGGSGVRGYWLVLRDERFNLQYTIDSHADYWDFLGYFADGKQWPAQPLAEVAWMARHLELVPPIHRCEIQVRGAGEARRYSLTCDLCGYIGTVATMEAAGNVARLHEDFIAPLLKAWSLPS